MNYSNSHNREIDCPVSISVYKKIWQKALDKEDESITMTANICFMNQKKGGQDEYALCEKMDYFVANLGYITKELFQNRKEAQQESIRFRDLFKRNRDQLMELFENNPQKEFPSMVEAYQFFISRRVELVSKALEVGDEVFLGKHKEVIPSIPQLIAYFDNLKSVRADLEAFLENSDCETIEELRVINRSKKAKIVHPFFGVISLPSYLNRYMVSKMIHSPFRYPQALQTQLLLELLQKTGLLDEDEKTDSKLKGESSKNSPKEKRGKHSTKKKKK